MATGTLAGNVSLSASSRSSSRCASAAAGALFGFVSVSTTCFNLHFGSLHNAQNKGGNERGCDRVSPMTGIEFVDGALRVDAVIIGKGLGLEPSLVQARMREGKDHELV